MDSEILKLCISENNAKIVLVTLSITTLIGVILGFTKKAIFYRDYNDLGLSLAVFGIPLALLLIFYMFNIHSSFTGYFIGVVFILLFFSTIIKTYTSNEGRIIPTAIISISKLILSFLYIIHLFISLTDKKRQSRGQGWFVLAIFTPLLLGLVHTKEGSFKLTSYGRPRIW